ncbi:hypothetical protein HK097_003077 [Rhizophlyctis rosea]|uniref:P-loop containing nucleoside triphosphate hydrolase protein n=1 Tax=Rhizophlyctis rosea TaxID=64517 RepID=A0AAD5SIF6_9FUNG|nr:hypothetical protein HK097_003077 [Rhizophlyctis rosea]
MCASSHPARQGDVPTRNVEAEGASSPTSASQPASAPPLPSRPMGSTTPVDAAPQFAPPAGPPQATPYQPTSPPQSPTGTTTAGLAAQMSNLSVGSTSPAQTFFDAAFQPTPLFQRFFDAYFAAVDRAIFPHNTQHWEPVKIIATHEAGAATEALQAFYDKVPCEYIRAEVQGTTPPQHFAPTQLDSFTAAFVPKAISQQLNAANAELRKQPILTRNGAWQVMVFYMLSNPADTYTEVVNTLNRYQIHLPLRFERGLLPTGAVPFWRDKLGRIQSEIANEIMHAHQTKLQLSADSESKPTDKLEERCRKRKSRVSNIKTDKPRKAIRPELSPDAPELRWYQKECIESCIRKLEEGVKRQVVSLPVGSGKTMTFTRMIPEVPVPFPGATRTLVLAHREELLKQAQAHFNRCYPNVPTAIELNIFSASPDAEVVFASVATLGRKQTPRIQNLDPKNFKCIIIDEAHHAAAPVYDRILQHFGTGKKDNHIFLWGCSATLRRHDGVSLKTVFDEITYVQSVSNLINEGKLCDLKPFSIKTGESLDGVAVYNKDFVVTQLAAKVNNPKRNRQIVEHWLAKREAEKFKTTLVFAADVKHIEDLVREFEKAKVKVQGLHGSTQPSMRRQILSDFAAGNLDVVVNCGIMTEGFDVPRIDCIVQARPTQSGPLLSQMIGRGMRPAEGKEYCVVLDFVDNLSVGFSHLATVPTLLGLPPEFRFDGETINFIHECVEKYKSEQKQARKKKEIVVTTVAELKEDTTPLQPRKLPERVLKLADWNPEDSSILEKDHRILRRYSRNAWVRLDADTLGLSITPEKLLIVRRGKGDLYNITMREKVRSHSIKVQQSNTHKARNFQIHYHQFVPICQHDHVISAIAAADSYASKKSVPHLIEYGALWRRDPATEHQINLLGRMGVAVRKGITKGQAAALLTRVQWGKHVKRMSKGKGVDGRKTRKKNGGIQSREVEVGGDF